MKPADIIATARSKDEMSVFRFYRQLDRLHRAAPDGDAWRAALAYASISQADAESAVAAFGERIMAGRILRIEGKPSTPLLRVLAKRQRRLAA